MQIAQPFECRSQRRGSRSAFARSAYRMNRSERPVADAPTTPVNDDEHECTSTTDAGDETPDPVTTAPTIP